MWKDLESGSVEGVFSNGPFTSARPGLSAEIEAALSNEAVVSWLTPEEIAQIRDLHGRAESLYRRGHTEAAAAAYRWIQAILLID